MVILDALATLPPRAIKVAAIPFSIVITRDGKTAFVHGEKSTLTPVTLATGRTGKPISIPPVQTQTGLSAAPVLSRDGRTIYVTPTVMKGRMLVPVDVASRRAEKPIGLKFRPDVIVLSPDGKTLYLVNRDSGTVTPTDVASWRALPTIKVRGYPGDITMAPDGRTAYVISSAAAAGSISTVGVVTAIDTRTQAARVVSTVAGEPVAIVIAP